MEGDGRSSYAEHQSADVSKAGCKSDDEDGQDDEQSEMLLALLDAHLHKEPDDEADQSALDQREQPGTFTPIDAQGIVDAATELNNAVAHGVFFSVAKHVDPHHGGKSVAQLAKDHAQDHRVSQKGFVGQEFNRMT